MNEKVDKSLNTKPDVIRAQSGKGNNLLPTLKLKLVSPETASRRLNKYGFPFSPQRLVELAKCKLLPHYVVDGKWIMFEFDALELHIRKNFVKYKKPDAIQQIIPVFLPDATDVIDPPISLFFIKNLKKFTIARHPPCVYFLCKDKKVVYIGQTVDLYDRINSHLRDGRKEFDEVYYVSIPTSELSKVESAFIKVFKPKYNYGRDGQLILPDKSAELSDMEHLIDKQKMCVENKLNSNESV